MSIGERFQEYLEFQDISQKDVAKEMGIAPSQLSNMVNGNRPFNEAHIKSIMRIYPDLNMNWLFRDNLPEGEHSVNEPGSVYLKTHEATGIISEIEEKLAKLKEMVSQK